MLRKHIVVVGSGWAGLRLVRKLKKVNYSDIRITLVSDSPNFRYSAALYRAATGFKVQEAIIPISQLTSDIPSLSFIKSKATKINKQKRIITLSGGQELHYDYAVLALGSVTTYFGIPGLSEYSYGIKSLSEIDRLRNHLHKELLENNKPDKNYIVVGAGPTGVELSAALISYLKKASKRHGIKHRRINIELIEASPRVLPRSLPKVSKLVHKRLRKIGVKVKINSKVEYETDTDLVVDGKSIPSKTVIWTSGVSNSPFYNANKSQFMLNNRSQVIVDDHLRVDKRLFVIGDNAVTPYTGLGLTAVHNASFVANEIIKKINGHNKTKPYKPLVPATVIPVGNRWGNIQL
jgi:NADH dehydrogenase